MTYTKCCVATPTLKIYKEVVTAAGYWQGSESREDKIEEGHWTCYRENTAINIREDGVNAYATVDFYEDRSEEYGYLLSAEEFLSHNPFKSEIYEIY